MAKKRTTIAATEADIVDTEEQHAEAVAMAVDTLTGDLRDFVLETLRFEQSKRPWHERSEADQRDTVHRVDARVRLAITQAVDLIAGHGRTAIQAHIEKAKVKDGIKATLTCGRSDKFRHMLLDAVGSRVMIVIADPSEFDGERAPAAITPDQGDLAVGEAVAVVHSEADDNHTAPFH
jgi:hypothetical protein